jgi:hypothetical protein
LGPPRTLNFTSPLILSHLKRFVTAQKARNCCTGYAQRNALFATRSGKICSTPDAVSGIEAIDSAIGPSALIELFSR